MLFCICSTHTHTSCIDGRWRERAAVVIQAFVAKSKLWQFLKVTYIFLSTSLFSLRLFFFSICLKPHTCIHFLIFKFPSSRLACSVDIVTPIFASPRKLHLGVAVAEKFRVSLHENNASKNYSWSTKRQCLRKFIAFLFFFPYSCITLVCLLLLNPFYFLLASRIF